MDDVLTSDNPLLSELTLPLGATNFAINVTPSFAINCQDANVRRFIEAATASNTRRAYQSDLRHFLSWGGRIPANDQLIARYLADHASRLTMATLARRLVGIRSAHVALAMHDPTKSELVRLTLRGIRRKCSKPQRRVAALGIHDLLTIVTSMGQSIKDVRDAALLLIGFAGAFRRSELIAIDCEDVEIGGSGLVIQIRRSKTDQDGNGRKIAVPRGKGALCPVEALERWLATSAIVQGPMFRPVARGGRVSSGRISGEAVARIVKARLSAIGQDASRYSGHSLRAGFATAAAKAEIPLWRIKSQTGHASEAVLQAYIRDPETSHGTAFKPLFVV